MVARRKDGSPSYMEVSASTWRTGSRLFVTAILRDVNERRAAEDALRRLNQTLELRVAERTADRDRMWRLSTPLHVSRTISRTRGRLLPPPYRQLGCRPYLILSTTITIGLHLTGASGATLRSAAEASQNGTCIQ